MNFLRDLTVFIQTCFFCNRVPFFPLTDPRLRLRPFFFCAAIFFVRKLLKPFFGFFVIPPSLISRRTSSEVIASSMSATRVGSIQTRLSPHFIIFAAIVLCPISIPYQSLLFQKEGLGLTSRNEIPAVYQELCS